MRGLRRLAPGLLAILSLSGCIDPRPVGTEAFLRVGDSAQYRVDASRLGEGELRIEVMDIGLVRDSWLRLREALEIQFEFTGRHTQRFSSYVDLDSGRVIFDKNLCPLWCDEDRISVFFQAEGLPGLLGTGAPPPTELPDVGLFHHPFTFVEAEVVVLPGEAFPMTVADGETRLSRLTFAPGTGPAFHWPPPPRNAEPPPARSSLPFSAWDRVLPPEGRTQDRIPYTEATAWASQNDDPFGEFLRRHPDAFLVGTWEESPGGGVGAVNFSHHERELLFAGGSGEVWSVRVERTVVAELPGPISLLHSRRSGLQPTVERGDLPNRLVNYGAAQSWAASLVGRPMEGTTISWRYPTETEAWAPTDTLLYRVFLDPGVPLSGVSLTLPHEVRIDAATGRILYLFAPRDTW